MLIIVHHNNNKCTSHYNNNRTSIIIVHQYSILIVHHNNNNCTSLSFHNFHHKTFNFKTSDGVIGFIDTLFKRFNIIKIFEMNISTPGIQLDFDHKVNYLTFTLIQIQCKA